MYVVGIIYIQTTEPLLHTLRKLFHNFSNFTSSLTGVFFYDHLMKHEKRHNIRAMKEKIKASKVATPIKHTGHFKA